MYKRKRLHAEEYIEGILSGNRFKLSKSITLIESQHLEDRALAEKVINGIMRFTGNAIRLGITGSPGVGKSTFIEAFGNYLIEKKEKKIAVLAVDPTSPESSGSIMGDKTRMSELSKQRDAFIRPSSAGTSLGGVARKTRETMLLCEAAGYDIILIETVGIGQSEVAVKQMTDFFLLLGLAGAGDELQGIKKGVMEMADMIAITKTDGDNTKRSKMARAQYQNALHLFRPKASQWTPRVVTCSALEGRNIDLIWDKIKEYVAQMRENGWLERNRIQQKKRWMDESIRDTLMENFYHSAIVQAKLVALTAEVEMGEISPYTAAHSLIKAYGQMLKNEEF